MLSATVPAHPGTFERGHSHAQCVVSLPRAKQDVLAAIKVKLWENPNFCHFVAHQVTENWGERGELDAHVKAALDTLDIVIVSAKANGSERPTPAYLILGKPVSHERAAHQEWVRSFKAPKTYWRGAYCLKVGQAQVDCKLCKSSTAPSSPERTMIDQG
ncbi:hypothetical protein FKP32DRAFT_1671735 [Trametes sanguinea]|nr:hypothetical protein FKP32DRAFT_1671735 [Trametes sanguinea]